MIKKIFTILAFSALASCNWQTSQIDVIDRYKVDVSEKAKEIVGVYPMSIGSSLKFAGKEGDKLIFYGLTDRGPNNTFNENGKEFLVLTKPDFTPSILKIEVDTKLKTAEVVDALKLSFEGKEVGAINTVQGNNSSEQAFEIPIDTDRQIVSSDRLGIDSEGLAIDADGNFWMVDEYGPSLNYVDSKTGEIKVRFTQENGLPEILKWRQVNRGFEAVAVAPNGLVYIALEGTLDINKETKDSAQFIRLIEFNPKTITYRMFAYPYEQGLYKSPSKVRIGDMDALSDDELVLIEQGPDKDGQKQNLVFKVSIKDAKDITNTKIVGKDLEYLDLDNLKDVLLKKERIFDARKQLWKHKKMEGLAVVDQNSIAIINDNDFGLGDVEFYVDENGQRKVRVPVVDNLKDTDLWIVKFKNKLG